MSKFVAGQPSPNPSGRPKNSGVRQKLFNELVLPHKDKIVETALNLALSGNEAMLRLMLERLLPRTPADEPLTPINLDDMSLTNQGKKIISLMANGELAPSEGNALLSALSTHAKLIETDELAERITNLERKR